MFLVQYYTALIADAPELSNNKHSEFSQSKFPSVTATCICSLQSDHLIKTRQGIQAYTSEQINNRLLFLLMILCFPLPFLLPCDHSCLSWFMFLGSPIFDLRQYRTIFEHKGRTTGSQDLSLDLIHLILNLTSPSSAVVRHQLTIGVNREQVAVDGS